MKKITNEKGSITLYVIISILFIISILISAYVVLSNQQEDQVDIEHEIKEIYGRGVDDISAVYEKIISDVPDNTWDRYSKYPTTINRNDSSILEWK